MLKKNNTHNKFGLSYFIWLGCNYVVSITFVGTFATLSNLDAPNAIGINVLWIIVLEGLIVGVCAHICSRLAWIHHSYNNGGIYIFVRTSFGRFWGIFVAFMQYITLPFLITFQIMMLLRGTFSAPWVAGYDQHHHLVIPWYAFNFGAFGDLWMDLIGIVIYLFFSFVIFGGMKLYKRLNDLTASLKLIAASVLILAGLYLAFQNGHDNFKYWSTNSHLNLNGFVKAFNSCFYFFTGFEVFTTAGRNIASARKNIGIGVIIVLIINVLSHLIIAIIFFAAFNHFVQNMNMGTWNSFHNKFVVYGGTIMMIMFVITLKINLIMQDSLYGGTSLQPLAYEGFLPDRFQKLNHDNISTKASLLHMSLTILSLFIWLIIPDLIKGITLTREYGFMCTIAQSLTYHEPFTGASLTAASSAITIFIYAMMFAVAIKLGITKQMKLKIWEWIVVPITMLILFFVLIWHYYTLINNILTATKATYQSALISGLIEFIFIGTAISFVTIWYFTYYRVKYCKRILCFPEQQAKIEQNFQVISQSKLVYEHIYQILLRYLKYYHQKNNAKDYQTVLQILTQLEHDFFIDDEERLTDEQQRC